MTDRSRLVTYLATLVLLLALAYAGGWALRPALGYDDPPPPEPTPTEMHEMDQ
jgi:hypothetical protein